MDYKGILFCLSGPAGTGKDSIKKKLLAENPALSKWVSTSSRKPRSGEIDGVDYFFISQENFEAKIAGNELIEYDKINDSYYVSVGTKEQFSAALQEGRIILQDITVEGVRILKRLYDCNVICIFIVPPSLDELGKRLKLRGDSSEVIQARLELAEIEMLAAKDANVADYVVLNDDLDKAVRECSKIINNLLCNKFDL